MVSAASRMLSAISFDHGDHAIDERLARVGGGAHDEPVGQHARSAGDGAPVAAALTDHGRALAGDGALVHRRHALDDLAVARQQVTRAHQHHVTLPQHGRGHDGDAQVVLGIEQLARHDVGTRPPQRVGLRLAASLRHRLGEVCEQHREPQPHRHRQHEGRGLLALAAQGQHAQRRGQQRAHQHGEHDRVPHLVARIQLAQRGEQRAADDGGIEQRARRA
jgi:hypothetical protein